MVLRKHIIVSEKEQTTSSISLSRAECRYSCRKHTLACFLSKTQIIKLTLERRPFPGAEPRPSRSRMKKESEARRGSIRSRFTALKGSKERSDKHAFHFSGVTCGAADKPATLNVCLGVH
ncbi:uncharacterized [Tachysurus ichikawai]